VGKRSENQCGGEAGEALHEIPDSCAHAALMRAIVRLEFSGWQAVRPRLAELALRLDARDARIASL
jgi:hypothetical protein